MALKILFMIRDPFIDALTEMLEEVKSLHAEVKVLYTDNGISKAELLREVEDTDIIVVSVVKIDKEVIDHGNKLKYIIKFGAGYDNIDVNYASRQGIPVTNAPGQNADAVADLAFGLMLSAAREIPKKDQEIKRNQWQLSLGIEMTRKRLGIIGFGSVGKAIAKRALGFEMETFAFGNYKDLEVAEKLNVRFVELDELLSTSDFVILCTSLTEHNRKMMNKETLKIIKPTAFLINISRGDLINEDDLIEALIQNRLKGAALDVFASEPPTNVLAKLPNVVATPHNGGATYEAIQNIGAITMQNLRHFLKNEELDFVIKP